MPSLDNSLINTGSKWGCSEERSEGLPGGVLSAFLHVFCKFALSSTSTHTGLSEHCFDFTTMCSDCRMS